MSSCKAVAPYSSLRHIAWSVWLNHDPDTSYMLIARPFGVLSTTEHTAYFDASGVKDQAAFFVSGFVASERQWLRFEEQWQALLDASHIKKPFHTTDYVSAEQPKYRQFKDKPELRARFERKAIRIIHENTRTAFSIGLDPRALVKVARHYDVTDVYRTPFNLCAGNVIVKALEWMARHTSGRGRVERLKFVFEDGDQDKGAFMDLVKKVSGHIPLFDTKENPAFAPADILAWRHARFAKLNQRYATGKYECFSEAFTHIPHYACKLLDTSDLPGALEGLGFRRLSQ